MKAAEGWLDLGNPIEALNELGPLAPILQGHPDVLHLRWRILVAARRWPDALAAAQALTIAAPADQRAWPALCKTLSFSREIQQAYDLAMARLPEFRDSFELTYDAACYACLLGKLDQAEDLLAAAMKLNDARQVVLYAQADPDLEAIRDRLREISL